MNYWETSKAAAAAAPSPSAPPSPPEPTRREPQDAARGRRQLDLDAAGRPLAWTDATGTALRFEHDADGNLRRIASGDWCVAIEGQHKRRTFAVTNPSGRTEMHLARGGRTRTLERGADRVSIELDDTERVRRVELPGSANALLYDWDEAGGCIVRAETGGPLLHLGANGGARRITLAPGTWLEEEIEPTRVRLRAATDDAILDTLELQLGNLASITERRWQDGSGDRFSRDASGRLASRTSFDGHGGSIEQPWHYAGPELIDNEQGRRTPGEAGRVLALDRPDGAHLTYRYDAAGRRIARTGPDGETHYRYDPLGTLCAVDTPDGRTIRYDTDGMGRRVATHHDGAVRHEHRDEVGRLWAVTDADGRPLHVYIWIGDRIAARLDGPIGAPVAEAYLADPFGTPNGVLVATDDGWCFERLDAPPFGHAVDASRPTLYGHFGDPATGLIHFGARDLDPELGLFLNPDPWHGGADDPRRWAGASDADLAQESERAAADWHDYALCRFDPLGRYDRDGHASKGDVVLHIVRWMLLPTWGFPLTAISLFFFQPLNFYMEIVGLIVWGFKQLCEDKTHPWGYNTIAKAQVLLGSSRQFTFALGLNGFLPRVVSGKRLNADRAVTVGNVIWINREELHFLARAEVVDLHDIGAAAPTAFNDSSTVRSLVALLCGDNGGKQRLHVSGWTHAPGNAVHAPPVGSTSPDRFADDPATAGGTAPGTIHLRIPVPLAIDVPGETDAKEKLDVIEFVHPKGTVPLAGTFPGKFTLQTLAATPFALDVPKDSSFKLLDWLRISAPKLADVAFRQVREVQPVLDRQALILDSDLPAALGHGLKVEAVAAATGAVPSPGWTTGAAPTTLLLLTPAVPVGSAAPAAPDISTDAFLQVVATTAVAPPAPATLPPGSPAPTAENTRFSAIAALRARLTLEPDRTGIAAGTKLQRMIAGSPFAGVVAKAAARGKINLTAPFPTIAKDDLLIVSGGAGTARFYVRAKAAPASGVLQIDPPLPATLVPADATRLDLSRAERLGEEPDVEVAAVPATGMDIDAKVPRGSFFAVDNFVSFVVGGSPVLRRIAAVPQFEVDLTEAPVGTVPFTLTRAVADSGKVRKGVSLAPADRFLKVMTPLSGSPGDWPGKLLSIQLTLDDPKSLESAAYYAKWPTATGKPASFAPEFRNSWTLTTSGASQFIVLEAPLPLIRRKNDSGKIKRWWRIQPDDYEGRTDIEVPDGVLTLTALEYTAAARRSDLPGHRLLAHEPEVLVPDNPTIHDTHRRALIEHEIHHTVQCNFWGPFMTALPVSGAAMTVTDMLAATGAELPDWLQPGNGPIDRNEELNWFQILSLGGMMQMAWKYVFLAPFLTRDNLRDTITDWDFDDFNKLFNPLSRVISNALPQVDPNAGAGTRWLEVLAQVAARALDLRSWTPGLGFVPTLLPDGATSFIEQEASRASGDLYSTILTANGRFNLRTRNRLFGEHLELSANLQSGQGKPIRLLTFCGSRNDRSLPSAAADEPGMAPVYRQGDFVMPAFTVAVAANPLLPPPAIPGAAVALFPASLYTVTDSAGATRPTVQIDGPQAGHAPSPFFEAFPGDMATPLPRAFVPLPPRVNRSMGFYLIPGGHCQMTVRSAAVREAVIIKLAGTAAVGDTLTLVVTSAGLSGPPVTIGPVTAAAGGTAAFADRVAGIMRGDKTLDTAGLIAGFNDTTIKLYARHGFDPVQVVATPTGAITATVERQDDANDDFRTETVKLNFSDEVKLGGDAIPWLIPAQHGALPTTRLKRFQLEENDLQVRAPRGTTSTGLGVVGIKELTLDVDPTIKSTPLPANAGWKLLMPKLVSGTPTRLRLFRVVTKADPAFDLKFPDVPSLKNVRSYLVADTFVVVRDLMLEVEALPVIAAQSSTWDKALELTLPIRLAQGVRGITITPPAGVAAPPVKRLGDVGRGEKWSIGPLPQRPAADAKFSVEITYGRPANTEARPFVLTFTA